MMLILFFRLSGETAARSFFNIYLDTALKTPTGGLGLVSGLAQLFSVPAALATPL